MAKQRYVGPTTTLYLKGNKTKQLVTGETYNSLPQDNNQVKNLVALKLLIAVDDKTAPKETQNTDA